MLSACLLSVYSFVNLLQRYKFCFNRAIPKDFDTSVHLAFSDCQYRMGVVYSKVMLLPLRGRNIGRKSGDAFAQIVK